MDRYLRANAVLSVFSRRYMALKQGLPIRPSEMGVLNIVTGTPGPHTLVRLAEMLGVSKPMITAHIAVLEKKGYIRKTPCAQDKRVCHILPTAAGVALAAQAKAELDIHLEQLSRGLGREEFDMLVRLAEAASAILEQEGE